MHSSTSSSETYNRPISFRIFIYTVALVALYSIFINIFELRATSAESNLNGILIRLQNLSYNDSSKSSTEILAGSSITAKLHQDYIFTNSDSQAINAGIDGGSPLFAVRKILELEHPPKTVVIESNLILRTPNDNLATINAATDSIIFRTARYLPFLSRDRRPVSVLYSWIKKRKDILISSNIRSISENDISIEFQQDNIEFNDDEDNMASEWGTVISALKKSGTSIILVMYPSGKQTKELEYQFSRKLSAHYDLPFIDLQGQLSEANLSYTDGIHLTYPSAHYVSTLLGKVITTNQL